MESSDTLPLTEHFGSLVYPRIDRTQRHNLNGYPHHRTLRGHSWGG